MAEMPTVEDVEDVDDDLHWVLNDAKYQYHQAVPNRRNTAFYWLVQGGHVKAVTNVLAAMKQHHMDDVMEWLLNLSKQRQSGLLHMLRRPFKKTLWFLLYAFIMVALIVIAITPFLGLVLAIIRASISWGDQAAKGQLPLYLAAYSGSLQMVGIMTSEGVTLRQTDHRKNNVFHLLVDLSIEDAEKASLGYKLLLKKYTRSELRHALNEHTNIWGLTPVECCIKYGSAQLFREITDTDGIIRHNIVTVTPNTFTIQSHEKNHRSNNQVYSTLGKTNNNKDPEQISMTSMERDDCFKAAPGIPAQYDSCDGFCLARYDVTPWHKRGCLNKRSLPLRLLNARGTTDLSKGDAQSILSSLFLSEWEKMQRLSHKVNVLGLIMRGLWVGLAVGLAVRSARDMNHLPLVEKFSELITKTRESQECTAINFTLGRFKLDSCGENALSELQDSCGSFNVTREIASLTETHLDDLWSLKRDDYDYPAMVALLGVFAIFNIIWYWIRHMLFIIQSFRGRTLEGGVRFAFATGIPGSTVDGILVGCSSWLMLIYMWLVYDLQSQSSTDEDGVHFEITGGLVNHLRVMIFVFCFYEVLVCGAGLYALRLLPGIGHFVITTLKMGVYLIKFLAVYGAVFILVAFLFHFVMRDTDCPAFRQEEFKTFYDSMLETFKLLLGHGDFYYGLNSPAKIIYVAYCAFCVLLLLNFIIAVMSSTTERLMREPWSKVIIMRENLQETLLANILIHTLVWPFGETAHNWQLRSQGFVVETDAANNTRVFIQVETTNSDNVAVEEDTKC